MGASQCLLNCSQHAITNQFTPHTGSCLHTCLAVWLQRCDLVWGSQSGGWGDVFDFENLVFAKIQCCEQQQRWISGTEKVLSTKTSNKKKVFSLVTHDRVKFSFSSFFVWIYWFWGHCGAKKPSLPPHLNLLNRWGFETCKTANFLTSVMFQDLHANHIFIFFVWA